MLRRSGCGRSAGAGVGGFSAPIDGAGAGIRCSKKTWVPSIPAQRGVRTCRAKTNRAWWLNGVPCGPNSKGVTGFHVDDDGDVAGLVPK